MSDPTVHDDLREVREVLALELAGGLSGPELIQRCTEVARLLQRRGAPDVPHEVWHYLQDADVRVRDRDFAFVQLEGIQSLLSRGVEEQ